jgi:hypothetical protein
MVSLNQGGPHECEGYLKELWIQALVTFSYNARLFLCTLHETQPVNDVAQVVLGFIHMAFGHQLHDINDVAYMWSKGGRQHLHGDATFIESRASDAISCNQFQS